MDIWYYRQHGEQKGPVSQEALIELFRSGQLPLDELVWSAGMEDWQAAYTVAGLLPPEFAHQQPTTSSDAYTAFAPSGPQARPWLRYWARSLDMVLFSLILSVVIVLIYPALLLIKPAYLNFFHALAYMFVEPLMLSAWGTTPGKALLKIRLSKADGTRLNYREALGRSFNVWVRGLGLALPIVNLFTHVTAYQRLLYQGRTSWDEDGGFVVTHQILGAQRIAFFVSVMLIISLLLALGIQEALDGYDITI